MVVSRRVGLLDVRFECARPKRCACRYQRCLQRQLQVCTRPDNSEAVSARIRRRIVDRHIHFLSASRVPQSSLQLQPERSARRGDGKIQVESRQVGNTTAAKLLNGGNGGRFRSRQRTGCRQNRLRGVRRLPGEARPVSDHGIGKRASEDAVSTSTTAAARPVTSSSSPAQTGTGGALVRKSKAYWDNYRSDIIRQVFDGGFGSDVDESTEFRVLFTSHVETFSKKCRAYLPARHETVTVTQVTTRSDRYGNVVSRQNSQPMAVEVDSRFAPKYRKYAASLGSTSAESLGAAIGIMSGRVSANTYFDIGLDADRFFQTESCQSAAMRQLGDNLLRGATGQLSLQQAGVSIAGASAETDKSAPTGRFTRFIDGCNAFYRDPANARYRKLDSDAWCKCLSDQYQHVMTPEQESYYANDYARHFRGEIAQPRESSTDPAWPRLHPAVERCAATTR